ncbi:MAG: hypothetical protein J3Q66DRAFT_423139 [Benniella sp.]|nr:MAG: hypothetical protein J3Q66DRAFT_423139 [Benniella sp.]
MGAISPQPSPAESKSSKLSLSAGVALTVLLLNFLLSVVAAEGKVYSGTLPAGQRFDLTDTLQSPDGSKTFRVTSRPHIFGIFDGSKTIWETEIDVPSPLNDTYLKLTSDSNGFAYHSINGSVLSSGIGSGYNSKELVLKDNGLLYIKDTNGKVIWMNRCSHIMSPNLVSKQSLPIADFCLLSPDENSFMKLEIGGKPLTNGKLVVYTGYTPQHTFERPYRQGRYLEFSGRGSLSITGRQCRDPIGRHWLHRVQYCYDAENRKASSNRFAVFVDALYTVVGSGLHNLIKLDDFLAKLLDIAENIHGWRGTGCVIYSYRLHDFQDKLILALNTAMPPSIDKNKLSGLVKSLTSDLFEMVCTYPSFAPYTLSQSARFEDTFTATVTNDAKISIKNSQGQEVWPKYPSRYDF